MVINSDMQIDFGSNEIMANASNGDYDLHFITDQLAFKDYDSKCAKYLVDVIRHIPLVVDSIDVIFADEYLILTTNVINSWMPDYVRRADGSILTVQAIPIESLVQPHDELWRNLIINKQKHQIIVVDRLIKNGHPYAIIYVLQSECKSSPYSRNIQYDITNPQNIQSVGTYLESLMEISIKALKSKPLPRLVVD